MLRRLHLIDVLFADYYTYKSLGRISLSLFIRLVNFKPSHVFGHLDDAHHLLQYLKGTTGQGVLLHSFKDFSFKAFVDLDWGSCLDR